MIEYWLLKKQLGGWSKVSWWDESEHDKAMRSYESMVKAGGYAYRLARVEIVQEHLLDEMIEEVKEEFNADKLADKAISAVESTWGKTPLDWGDVNTKPDNVWGRNPSGDLDETPTHGMVGKVWMINHITKERARVAPDQVEILSKVGWERGGPKTAFKGSW